MPSWWPVRTYRQSTRSFTEPSDPLPVGNALNWRSWPRRSRDAAVRHLRGQRREKRRDLGGHGGGGLVVREVPGAGDDGEPRVAELRDQRALRVERGDVVAVGGHQQGRRPDRARVLR